MNKKKLNKTKEMIYGQSKKAYEQIKQSSRTWSDYYGEGTKFDLDYGKLLIIFLCVYIAIKVS
tara:strand:+ start:1060 stop:1248 length:189 start_codon:yes stop_codon:yes gene_type:complete